MNKLLVDAMASALHDSAPKNHNLGEGLARAICQSPSSHSARARRILAHVELISVLERNLVAVREDVNIDHVSAEELIAAVIDGEW